MTYQRTQGRPRTGIPRCKLTPEERARRCAEALERAENSSSAENEARVIEFFAARGIDESDILPRCNCLTFNAWRAKGRTVNKRPPHIPAGEYGCNLVVWIDAAQRDDLGNPMRDERGNAITRRLCRTTTVFHITQTRPLGDPQPGDDYRPDDAGAGLPALPATMTAGLF